VYIWNIQSGDVVGVLEGPSEQSAVLSLDTEGGGEKAGLLAVAYHDPAKSVRVFAPSKRMSL
jgi:hypothetical protein